MGKKVNILVLTFLILSLFILGYLYYENNSLKKDLAAIKEDKGRLDKHVATLIREKDDLINERTSFPGLSDLNIRRFKKKGLADPENYIVNDLLQTPELIPVEGTLGGTPYFDRSTTWILSKQWVYAVFSDGHFEGKVLLKYNLADDHKINWEVLDYYLE
jgi:hypothetical protein